MSEPKEPTEEEKLKQQSEATEAYIDNLFSYHAPPPHIAKLHDTTNGNLKNMARYIFQFPATKEREMAITRLEEVRFWINACIARNHELFKVVPVDGEE